jgi:hypothetical protein
MRSTHLSTWVPEELKYRFAALAASRGISDSALLKQLVEFAVIGAKPEFALPPRLTCLLDDLRAHRKLPDVLGGSKHDSEPHQVICDGRSACALCAPRWNMIDQHCGVETVGIEFSERIALQEFEVRLLAPLPLGDRGKRLDIPTYQLGERWGSVLNTGERGMDPRGRPRGASPR